MPNHDEDICNQLVSFLVNDNCLYAITITVNCQRSQDLRVEIDGRSFRELPPEKYAQKFNIPPAFNGSSLKDKAQTNIFLLNLVGGQHELKFISQNNVKVTSWKIQKIDDPTQVAFNLNLSAQNLNRQSFLNIILVDLPLHSISSDISLNWHRTSIFRGDGDDVKLLVDGKIITDNRTDWLWRANKNQKGETKIQKKTTVTNLGSDTHYLEFIADRSPILRNITVNLSESGETNRYLGDFYCKTMEKVIDGENKKLLGIFKYGRNGEFVPSNERYRLYYNGEEQPVGNDLKNPLISAILIRFDLGSWLSFEDNWYYFGIDQTFWRTHQNWEKGHWHDDSLWTIYEK